MFWKISWVFSIEPQLEHKNLVKNVLLGKAIEMALTILLTVPT